MRKLYNEPEFKVVEASAKDVITTSEMLGFDSSNGYTGPSQGSSWGGKVSTGIEI